MPPGAAGLSSRKAVEPFERLWALACVAAREQGFTGAVDGLRGISYAEKAYQDFTHRGGRMTPDFKMLKYQGRTGGVGTYWTALVGGELVDADSGALMHEGRNWRRSSRSRTCPNANGPGSPVPTRPAW